MRAQLLTLMGVLMILTCAAHADDTANTAVPADSALLKLQYTGEFWDNVQGGAKRASDTINNLDANLAIDADQRWGWKGASFMFDGFYNNGAFPRGALTGAAQDVSPYDNGGVHDMWRLYQAWYNQDFNDGKTSTLIGLYDLNSEFDELDAGQIFLNSGYNWNSILDQSGTALGPSTWPNTSLALRLRQYISKDDGLSVQGAVLDGAPDNANLPHQTAVDINSHNGAMLVGEGDWKPDARSKYLLGYWQYTAKYNDQLVTTATGASRGDEDNYGVYAGAQHRLYSAADDRGLDGFASVGAGNPNTNRFDRSLAAGLLFTGPSEARKDDQIGLAWNILHNGYPYREAQAMAGTPAQANEQNFEMLYRAKIDDGIFLQPDVQYTVDPNTDPARKNDLIIGMHVEIGHLFGF